jgi:2,3-bisphosphoglycerate-independent phosphoglycerate mutase
MKIPKTPTALIILDGFGYSEKKEWNAIRQAKTPNFDYFFKNYPHAIIKAAGRDVGLPEGSIGNSEVGHLTIGSGRVVDQPAVRLNKLIADKKFASQPVLVACLAKVKKNNGALHIMGLLSDANVHSNEDHLFTFIDTAENYGIKKIYVHAFLDGRDTPPRSAAEYLQALDMHIAHIKKMSNVKLASIHGRFYAMDRDNNWERTKQTYDVLTNPPDHGALKWQDVLQQQYADGNGDEFVVPTNLDPDGIIKNGDGIIFFNFRPDRARQLTHSFMKSDFDSFQTKQIKLACFVTPTMYEQNHVKTDVLLEPMKAEHTLKEVLEKHGYHIFSVAETEKYAHVTYFFNGGKEQILPNEKRVMIKSISTRDYVHHPKMSALEITAATLESLQHDPYDFYLINYANADMVGHSGNMEATVLAVECIDEQIGKLYEQIVRKMGGTIFLTADHGNAESMYNEQAHQPCTAHTNNPVPFIMLCPSCMEMDKKLPLTGLSDIAPFILRYLNIPVPREMK